MSSAQYPIDDSEFEAGATDLSDLLELVEQKEAEEFGAEIDRNESEESRMIRQIALREIFVFLTDKSDQHVANLRVSKRGDHLKLNVNFERKQTNVERVTLLQDPHAKERLNIYPFPDALAGGSRTSLKRSLTPNLSTDVSETETAQPIPKNFVVNLCDRLVGLVMKHDPRKEVQK